MDVELKRISIREIVEGYRDNDEDGIVGYGGKLDIRPIYQREFVYTPEECEAVITSIGRGLPLNAMYWAVRDDGTYEIIDGQQRTVSVCQYVNGDYSVDGLSFHNLPEDKQQEILDYEFMVYHCTGDASEKLEWFKTINIAAKAHTKQELRNAVYAGSWVTDAKRYFSRTGCPAYDIAKHYMTGSPIRQEYLETAIKWINDGNIEDYMDSHSDDPNANELWLYFQSVIDWIEVTFPEKRKEMKSVDWGPLHKEFASKQLDVGKLESEISELMMDDDVEKKTGIYPYVLNRDERFLNIRTFSDSQKAAAYEKQKGICASCGKHFERGKMDGDHILPWSEGGKTEPNNLRMLCVPCNRR